MSRFKRFHGLLVIAGVLVLAGVVLAARSFYRTPVLLEQVDRKVEDLEQVLNIEKEWADDQAAIQRFEGLKAGRAPALSALLDQVLPDHDAEVRERDAEEAAGGWTVHRKEVLFNEAAVEEVFRFIEVAESQRPPWRVIECSITAVGNEPGRARVTLVLETLEKPAL